MNGFITVTTKGVSKATGQPKIMLVNVEHIVTVEPVTFDVDVSMDEAYSVDGCMIIITVNQAHIIELEARDPFEHVVKRIELAGQNVVRYTDDLPTVMTKEHEKVMKWLGHGE